MCRGFLPSVGAAGWAAAIVLALCASAWGQSPYHWSAGPSQDPNIFPISIWWQSYMDSRVKEWSGIGVNQYDGPDSPASADVTTLNKYHVKAIINYDGNFLGSSAVTGWLQPDEPDNYQFIDPNTGLTGRMNPSDIIGRYNAMKAADPNRPVLLGLGQGVCWPWNDPYYGRGPGSTWAQYQQYVQGGDIIAFDVYPYNESPGDAPYMKPWYVAIGVDRLKMWTNNAKPIWVDIETDDIDGSGHPPKAYQTKGEVWMALIHGVAGIQYFAQTWNPNGTFNREDGVFSPDPNFVDPNMPGMLKVLNAQIQHYSKVLYSPVITGLLDANLPVNWVQKQYGNMTYVFAVSMWDDPNVKNTTFNLAGFAPGAADANVMDESRKVHLTNGTFTDNFSSLSVHLYEVSGVASVAFCNVASGNWTDSNSWTSGLPAGVLQTVVNNGGQVLIGTGAVATGSVVTLGLNIGNSGTIRMTGGRMDANYVTVGQGGTGSFTLSGGTCTVRSSLSIAGGTGSVGSFALQDGNLVAPRITIGTGGTMTLSGGSLWGNALDANLLPSVVNSGFLEVTAGMFRLASIDCPDSNVLAGRVQVDAGAILWLGEFTQSSVTVYGTLVLDNALRAETAPLISSAMVMEDVGEPVPEPATLSLLALAGLAALRRRRRRE